MSSTTSENSPTRKSSAERFDELIQELSDPIDT